MRLLCIYSGMQDAILVITFLEVGDREKEEGNNLQILEGPKKKKG